MKLRFQPMISLIPRFSGSSASLDYANRWRGQHMELPITAIGSHVQLGSRSPPSSHPLRLIPTPSAKELSITFRLGIGIAYVTTIQNRHSETVDKKSISGPKLRRGVCVLVHRLSYTLGRTMRIFVCPAIGTAREAQIRNRHFNPVDTRSHSEISGPAPKFHSGSVVAGCRCDRIWTPLRSNRHNCPLGYQNCL
ncbi:hypothetical protein Taro_011128 [Colocasia esculenta]|uniref:Uncharacterized protein n=1 Tax=Colocasia esculenta TaxID=4460 RepID=A0A843UF45_COLES|nr:hypothetical protein [Colocasia esculenta]